MMRTLSSPLTFLMKAVLPVVWILGSGLGTLAAWTGGTHLMGVGTPSSEEVWQRVVLWVAGSAALLWWGAGLKRVRVDAETLYVSNYWREISVPLNLIADAKEGRWISPFTVTVYFRSTTDFGPRITFVPTPRLFGVWRPDPHPVVADLIFLAGRSQRDAQPGAPGDGFRPADSDHT